MPIFIHKHAQILVCTLKTHRSRFCFDNREYYFKDSLPFSNKKLSGKHLAEWECQIHHWEECLNFNCGYMTADHGCPLDGTENPPWRLVMSSTERSGDHSHVGQQIRRALSLPSRRSYFLFVPDRLRSLRGSALPYILHIFLTLIYTQKPGGQMWLK